jgi:dephospho-CoA kinase
LVARRRQEIIDAVHEDAVVVEDIPLLVETGMAPMFPLVVVVSADEETRVTRVVQQRGMDEADARARIKAQAPEEQRRAIADVLLENSGSQGELVEKARDLWYNRVLPLAHNIRTRQCAPTVHKLVPYDPAWPDDARRIINRIQNACGAKALRVDHVGSTAVHGMDAKDVIDIQTTIASLDVADEINDALANAGYPRVEHITTDMPHTADSALWRKRIHCAADPGRPANIHVRVDGWPSQQFALLFRDWLAANVGVQDDYLAAKRRALSAPDYADAMEPWFAEAYGRAWEWAETTGWRP